ncbi:hypothetical protein FPQ18DRAFT_51786 [Pyronema domesticum]|nr:hypothetical protein FPQ18DRAFT_51786 [Pyronema domesticum]
MIGTYQPAAMFCRNSKRSEATKERGVKHSTTRHTHLCFFFICLLHAYIALELLLLRASCSVSVQISGGLTLFIFCFFLLFFSFSCSFFLLMLVSVPQCLAAGFFFLNSETANIERTLF